MFTVIGALGQIGGPVTLLDLPASARGVISFGLVFLVGVVLLRRHERTVHRAVDLTVSGTPLAVVYGVVAFGLLAFVGGYVLTQLGRVTTSVLVLQGSILVLALAGTVLGGVGYLILGTWITDVGGARQPWPGAVIGAGLSALPWVLLPAVAAVGAWILLAAVGLGSLTREWVHGEQTVEARAER